jgi:hypothetical protein
MIRAAALLLSWMIHIIKCFVLVHYNNKRSFGQSSVRINGGLQFYFIIVQVEAAVAVRQTEAPSPIVI